MTHDNDTVAGNDVPALNAAINATHEALLLTEAVRQIDQALFWARQGRPDLSIVFTNMAKLMLLEGNGKESESDFWVLTTRSTIGIELHRPVQAVECATKALALGEVIFAQDPLKLAVARGNLGRALALLGRPEEARKQLSQGIFGLTGASHTPPASATPREQQYYREAFIEFARALQSLPPRPPRTS